MLKLRMKRLVHQGELASQKLAAVQAAIVALPDDDLLDLADIFKAEPRGWLADVAFVEMAKRGISL